MIFKPKHTNRKKGVFAFIDSQNLNLGTQKAGWKLDWSKFYQYLQNEHGVTRAYLFIGYMSEHEDMYNTLHELGYLIVLKPTVVLNDAPSANQTPTPQASNAPTQQTANTPEDEPATVARKPVKGNVDAELVLYAMKEMPNYEKAIIVSGDGDFYCLVEYLANKKRLKNVLTPNRQYSSLLKAYDEYIIRIDEMRGKLAYKDYRRRFVKKGDNR